MSRYRHNGDECPCCLITYGDFRCGLTYNDAFLELWSMDGDTSTWRYKRRRTILGYMHMRKKAAWRDHLAQCAQEFEFSFIDETAEETPQPALAVPF